MPAFGARLVLLALPISLGKAGLPERRSARGVGGGLALPLACLCPVLSSFTGDWGLMNYFHFQHSTPMRAKMETSKLSGRGEFYFEP